MKIVSAGYEFINEPDAIKKIERIARICYKSEDKIGECTDIKMVKALMKNQHTAMLEHASVVLIIDRGSYNYLNKIKDIMETCCLCKHDAIPENCYMRFTYTTIVKDESSAFHRYMVSGNLRAWYNFFKFAKQYGYSIPVTVFDSVNNASKHIFDEFADNVGIQEGCEYFFKSSTPNAILVIDFNELTSEERMIHEDISILFTVDRGVTHELVRHRNCSFAQESTRYCNYNLGKFGQEITVIEPCFWDITPENGTSESIACYNAWHDSCVFAEAQYFNIINNGGTPQQARDVLPTSVKAEIAMTTNLSEWKHIFNLRACDATGPAHPQMKEVMIPCMKEIRPQYDFAFGNLIAADEVTK